jgi:hypothetical protein
LKAALSLLNLATAEVRLPLIRATDTTRNNLSRLLNQIMNQEDHIASRHRYALAS